MQASRVTLLPVIVFLLITGIVLVSYNLLERIPLQPLILLVANAVLFLVTAFLIRKQASRVNHPNPNVFVRGTLGGTLLKMAVVVVGIMAYRFLAPDLFNKFTVLAIMGLYFLYLFVEVKAITLLTRKSADG